MLPYSLGKSNKQNSQWQRCQDHAFVHQILCAAQILFYSKIVLKYITFLQTKASLCADEQNRF